MLFGGLYALLFSAVAEWLFWDEFGSRFNFIAVDYLVYRQEVTSNISESYPLQWILPAIGLVALALTGAWTLALRNQKVIAGWRYRAAIADWRGVRLSAAAGRASLVLAGASS